MGGAFLAADTVAFWTPDQVRVLTGRVPEIWTLCEGLVAEPRGGGCPYQCRQDPGRSGYVYCTDACSTCIVSGNCRPFVASKFEADGTVIEQPSARGVASLIPARVVRASVLDAGVGALVAEAAFRFGLLRRTCEGMIVGRMANAARGHEVRVQARRVLI